MAAKFMRQFVGAVFLVATPAGSWAQDNYPSHAIKIIVPIPPGAAADSLPRIIADSLTARWGQPVIVENRPGGALNIGAEAVAKAKPDGYTLLATPAPPLAINQSLYPKLGYTPNDFVPVTVMAVSPTVLVANPKVPFSTVQELIAFAKANPGKLTYASSGIGSTPHLAMELLKIQAGIEMVHVPYKGLVPSDLLAGHVDIMFNIVGNTSSLIQGGNLKALAVGSKERLAMLPNVPAMAEIFPGFEATSWFAMVAPPKSSREIAVKLSAAIAEILQLPDVAESVRKLSMTPVGSTPAQTATFIQDERQRWHHVIASAGIKPD